MYYIILCFVLFQLRRFFSAKFLAVFIFKMKFFQILRHKNWHIQNTCMYKYIWDSVNVSVVEMFVNISLGKIICTVTPHISVTAYKVTKTNTVLLTKIIYKWRLLLKIAFYYKQFFKEFNSIIKNKTIM